MGIAFFFIGAALGSLGYALKYIKPKYQYERTTTGRTVRFMDHDESIKHIRLKLYGKLMIFIGIIVLGMGLIKLL